ncbi:MAG: VWA domain-containing protein, partial [Chloroflexota bacterium]|nr:VWA domain-containing protein [Chloroflexota bacterium]
MTKVQRILFATLTVNMAMLLLFLFTEPPRVTAARLPAANQPARTNPGSGQDVKPVAAVQNGTAFSLPPLPKNVGTISPTVLQSPPPPNAPAAQSSKVDVSGVISGATVFAEPQFNRMVIDVRIKNTGKSVWSPNAVLAEIDATNTVNNAKRHFTVSAVVPPAPVQPGQEVSIRGFAEASDFWSGSLQLSIVLKVDALAVDSKPSIKVSPTTALSVPSPKTAVAPLAMAPGAGSLDLVIAIDSTGSMCGTIDTVKANAKDIADRIRSTLPDSRFAFIRFRDFADGPPWPTIIGQDLTYDVNAFKTAVDQAYCG